MKAGLLGRAAVIATIAHLCLVGGATPSRADENRLEIVPSPIPGACSARPGHRQILFDLCRDQRDILAEAKAKAAKSGKIILISYGADWCIWCHAFEAHLLGQHGRFQYATDEGPWLMQEKGRAETNAAAAMALQTYVAKTFVVVNISEEAGETALAVLQETQADTQFKGGLPFIYALDRKGKYARAIDSGDVEIRRDGRNPYRGYDRMRLLRSLQSLAAASAP